MADQTKIQAQRSDSNVFAYRRLKWGSPPERFRVDHILRRRIGAAIQSLPALPDPHKVQDDAAVAARPSIEMFQPASVADPNKRRMCERFADTAAWDAAIVSVGALAGALVWTAWG